MSSNCWRSVSGSSESASSCSRVSTVPKVAPRSEAAVCLSWLTTTVSLWPSIGSITTCLLLPFLTRTSGIVRASKPAASAFTA